MSRSPILVLAVFAASLVATSSTVAQAVKDVAGCKPVFEALTRHFSTPSHVYETVSRDGAGSKGDVHEMITAGGSIYITMNGKWERSPMTPQQMEQQEQENIRTATGYSCRHLRDEPVNGVSAAVYSAHSEDEGRKSDAQIWIAKSSGLILRTETDMDTGSGDKTHMSARYDYSNVRAPVGVR